MCPAKKFPIEEEILNRRHKYFYCMFLEDCGYIAHRLWNHARIELTTNGREVEAFTTTPFAFLGNLSKIGYTFNTLF